jgi:hypothetical protein
VRRALELPLFTEATSRAESPTDFTASLRAFSEFGKKTQVTETHAVRFDGRPVHVETLVNEYWTSKQRAAHSLHEISYRACFKPQLPQFFIERLTRPGDVVYDPFMGRGTTPLEAALLGRLPIGCDINPLSTLLVRPRLSPPTLTETAERLAKIDLRHAEDIPKDLLAFYHPETLREICTLREYLMRREETGEIDAGDQWTRMVAINRLTGHSAGFFSVYTLPPNQAVSVAAQRKINAERKQTPPRRSVPGIIQRKTKSLLRDCDEASRRALARAARGAAFLTRPASETEEIPSSSVHLVVTSPPFLDVVGYAEDNWLRCWFCGIDPDAIRLTTPRKLEEWQREMARVFDEIARVLRPGGHVAFEVGEVHGGKVRLEEAVVPCGIRAGLAPLLVLINDQRFTKTSNCWGVKNNQKGTNTNRVVVFRKDD